MQGESAVHGKGPHKLLSEAGIIAPDPGLGHLRVKNQKGAVGEIQDGEAQCLIHGDVGGSKAADALPVSQGPAQGLSQDNTHVLHRVVAVHLEISLGPQFQPQAAVKGKRSEHMVEKADAGGYLDLSPVQAEVRADVGLLGLPLQNISPNGSIFPAADGNLHYAPSPLAPPASKRVRMELAWAVSFSVSARAMISSRMGNRLSRLYSMTLMLFKKLSTLRGEKKRAVPLVGSTWSGPAR